MMTNASPLLALIFFLASPLLSRASDSVHLFLLSGQSNMANLKPDQVFTPAIHKHFGADNVVIVKVAKSGQPIRRWYKNWKVTGDQNPSQIGDLYEQLTEATKKALDDRPIESVTLICMQGERDAKERLCDYYEEAFLGIVKQIKTDLNVRDINYIIGRLSDSGLGKKDWDHVRAVQEKLGNAGPRSAWINTDDLNDDNVGRDGTPLKPNDLHYSEKGYRLLAERFASKAIDLLSIADQTTKDGQ